MQGHEYPAGIDFVWLARDREGHVAAFVTAGTGPIPRDALPQVHLEPTPEELLALLPRCSAVLSLGEHGDTTSFEAMASRGFYVFDWSDAHRSAAKALDRYELVSKPLHAAMVGQLPASLGSIVAAVTLPIESFASSEQVRVEGLRT